LFGLAEEERQYCENLNKESLELVIQLMATGDMPNVDYKFISDLR